MPYTLQSSFDLLNRLLYGEISIKQTPNFKIGHPILSGHLAWSQNIYLMIPFKKDSYSEDTVPLVSGHLH